MKKTASFLVGASLLAAAAAMPLAALAQTSAAMPTLYDQSGNAVNTGSAKLAAGTYYLQTGGQHPVQYYGNGTYYDASIGQYGGSVNDPNGTAGASLGYATSGSTVASNPGVPNTGAGGDAAVNWTLLVVSALVVLGGSAFMAYSFSSKNGA